MLLRLCRFVATCIIRLCRNNLCYIINIHSILSRDTWPETWNEVSTENMGDSDVAKPSLQQFSLPPLRRKWVDNVDRLYGVAQKTAHFNAWCQIDIALWNLNQILYFLADLHLNRFPTKQCIYCPQHLLRVSTLPCRINIVRFLCCLKMEICSCSVLANN